MAGSKYKKETISRPKRNKSITKGKKPGEAKKLSDLPSYKTAKKRKAPKKTGIMASVSRKLKK